MILRGVYENLYCGDIEAYTALAHTDNTAIVSACKDPVHRAMVGYTGRGCPKDSPHYLFIEQGNRLGLNMIDAHDPIFFDKEMIDKALEFIDQKLNEGYKVLVHCNEGRSRSASLALLYLVQRGIIKDETFEDCEAEFLKLYPEYLPSAGIRGFMKQHWGEYAE